MPVAHDAQEAFAVHMPGHLLHNVLVPASDA